MFNTLELFVGCGGLVEGLKKSREYEILACVEWEKAQCEVLRNRLANKYEYENVGDIVMQFDIQRTKELLYGWNDEKYGTSKGLKHIVSNKNVDIITGGPPCQAYSLAGRIQDPNGMKDDYRNYLFESYLEVVRAFNPKIVVFENVEGILSAKPDGFNIIEKIKNEFNSIGYTIVDDIRKNALIDISEYGVPQKRKRVILIGLNNNYYDSPQDILSDFYQNILPQFKEKKTMTVQEAIGDLPPLYPNKEDIRIGRKKHSHKQHKADIKQHESRYHNKRDIGIFKELAYDIESGKNKYSSIKSLRELYTLKTGKSSNIHKYNVLKRNLPSNTIPAHLKKDGLRHIHPDSKQARSITVREAARLQTFDDDFEFSGIMSRDFEMIGNAIPPKFATKLGLAIKIILQKASV